MKTAALAILALALAATWTGTWTGNPQLTPGTNKATCCSTTTNNYSHSSLEFTLHRSGAGYHIYSTGPLNGPSPNPGESAPFVYASTNATLTSVSTSHVLCSSGTLIAGGDWPWGGAPGKQVALARIRFPGCPIFNRWTVVELDNGTSASAVVN